jgi:hypothetical protein
MHAVAEQLWQQTLARDPKADASTLTEKLFSVIDVGLRRWIGAEGFASLLSRAIAESVEAHPILARLPDFGGEAVDPLITTSHAADVAPLDPSALHAAVQALLIAMMRRLGDIIGDNMAIRLMEQSGTQALPGAVGTEPKDLSS